MSTVHKYRYTSVNSPSLTIAMTAFERSKKGLNLERAASCSDDSTDCQQAIEVRGSDRAFLTAKKRPRFIGTEPEVRIVDLFCGAGGITLGLVEAAHSLGLAPSIKWAVDFEARALAVYSANFPSANAEVADLSKVFQSDPEAKKLTTTEQEIARAVGDVDILVGGPPCQGHSDLNNFSRRDDPKNGLYMVMARAAKVLKPKMVLIENVPGVKHDRGSAFARTGAALEKLGYHVSFGVVNMHALGVPQTRRRMVMLASRFGLFDVEEVASRYRTEARTTAWAIKELVGKVNAGSIADTASTPSADNKRRIDYLFENELYELPDAERPPCHRDGGHSYKSIYGRLRWDEPAQTITSGFYSMCMGRYVHPVERRTLTAKEAARLQFFPEYFSFEAAGKRTALAKIIGNAVPPKLSFVFGHSMMSRLLESEAIANASKAS